MPRHGYSLKSRLVALLLALIGVIWAGIVMYSYFDIRHESEELLDAHLAQSASLIIAQAEQDLEEIEVEHAPQFKEGHRVAFQLWERGERLRLHSRNAPNTRFSAKTSGFSDVVIEGTAWRVFSAWTRGHGHLIQVAERESSRRDITRAMTLNLLMPLLAMLPLLGLLVWLAVAQALRPLARLGREVARRDPANLEPLVAPGSPREIQPLIDNLNALFERVTRLIEHERRFTADAAHELRTPLAGLMMQAQVARAATDGAERGRALDQVITGCGRAARLVDQMLTLARLEPENAVGVRENLDPGAIAREVVADIAPLALQRGIDIAYSGEAAVQARGNGELLRVALRNLVDNAVRYSPDGGQVLIAVAPAEDRCRITVTDRGCGMSAEDLHRVGQRFYRVPGHSAPGSGLGLSIVRRIAELHGGSLALHGNPDGRGLSAVLDLPRESGRPL